jgi:hypothetical protein
VSRDLITSSIGADVFILSGVEIMNFPSLTSFGLTKFINAMFLTSYVFVKFTILDGDSTLS